MLYTHTYTFRFSRLNNGSTSIIFNNNSNNMFSDRNALSLESSDSFVDLNFLLFFFFLFLFSVIQHSCLVLEAVADEIRLTPAAGVDRKCIKNCLTVRIYSIYVTIDSPAIFLSKRRFECHGYPVCGSFRFARTHEESKQVLSFLFDGAPDV